MTGAAREDGNGPSPIYSMLWWTALPSLGLFAALAVAIFAFEPPSEMLLFRVLPALALLHPAGVFAGGVVAFARTPARESGRRKRLIVAALVLPITALVMNGLSLVAAVYGLMIRCFGAGAIPPG